MARCTRSWIGLLFRRADVLHHPVLRDRGRVVLARRVEGRDRRVVEVVGARVGRVGVAVEADKLHRQVLRHPDAAAATVLLHPVLVAGLALALREAVVVERRAEPVDDVVEPRAAVVAPSEIRVGDVGEGVLCVHLRAGGADDLVEADRDRLVRCRAGRHSDCGRHQGDDGQHEDDSLACRHDSPYSLAVRRSSCAERLLSAGRFGLLGGFMPGSYAAQRVHEFRGLADRLSRKGLPVHAVGEGAHGALVGHLEAT